MRLGLSWVLLLCLTVAGRAGDDFKSGPAVGNFLPGSFAPYNLNGVKGKDRPHCLVTEFGLDPVVAVFARESVDTPEPGLGELLKKLEQACEKNKDQTLRAFVVFLSPDGRSARTEKGVEDPKVLVQEAMARDKLITRLREAAKPFQHVVFALHPDGPPGYQINSKPGITVVVYAKHRVEMNAAFAEGKLKGEDADRILKGVDALLAKQKK